MLLPCGSLPVLTNRQQERHLQLNSLAVTENHLPPASPFRSKRRRSWTVDCYTSRITKSGTHHTQHYHTGEIGSCEASGYDYTVRAPTNVTNGPEVVSERQPLEELEQPIPQPLEEPEQVAEQPPEALEQLPTQ